MGNWTWPCIRKGKGFNAVLAPKTANMTPKDGPSPASAPIANKEATRRVWSLEGLPSWGRNVLVLTAGGILTDVAFHGLQEGGSWLGLGALASGWVWLVRAQVGRSKPQRPKTVESWIERCESVLSQFTQLDPDSQAQVKRSAALQALLIDRERTHLRLALVSSDPLSSNNLPSLQAALRGSRPLQLVVSDPLPRKSACWQWSDRFASCDALVFHLRPPLMASELRWLEAIPKGTPLWVLMDIGGEPAQVALRDDLCSQWPGADPSQILAWDGDPDQLAASLLPFSQWLAREGRQIHMITLCRGLEQLHGRWQADLERLRRGQWRQLQRRSQWLVAAGVMLTPAISLDLLVLAVGNGLMLREMARLWDCHWTLEQLQAAAVHLGKAALVLGVVEWCNQAFATAFKLHGSTWLVGGTLQALSAAYLTRVIGHAMADLMARNVGVSEPDLAAIKAEAPLLVAKASEAERLDWGAFLQDAQHWLRQQDQGSQAQAQGT